VGRRKRSVVICFRRYPCETRCFDFTRAKFCATTHVRSMATERMLGAEGAEGTGPVSLPCPLLLNGLRMQPPHWHWLCFPCCTSALQQCPPARCRRCLCCCRRCRYQFIQNRNFIPLVFLSDVDIDKLSWSILRRRCQPSDRLSNISRCVSACSCSILPVAFHGIGLMQTRPVGNKVQHDTLGPSKSWL
jgi:hypothetical protein